jgi:hypothetical protein
MIFIIAMAIFFKTKISFIWISALILFYAGALSLNALYIQSIGSGIGIQPKDNKVKVGKLVKKISSIFKNK